MALVLNYQSLGIQKSVNSCQVPENKLAKLMYYLDCAFYTLDIRCYSDYTDYYNYRNLTRIQEQYVLSLARTYNPTFMLDNQFFIIRPNLVDYGFDNQFYQITDKRIGIRANSQVFIGGKSVTAVKVMACKDIWLQKYYYDPLSYYDNNNGSPSCCINKKVCFCMCYCILSIIIIFLLYHVYEAYIS